MKKGLCLLIVCLLMMITVFVSCNQGGDPNAEQSGEQGSNEKNTGNEVNGQMTDPYRLTFESNGDGTCTLTDVQLNLEWAEDFVLLIPEKSPAGETVTGISLQLLYDFNALEPFPIMLKEETFERVVAEADWDSDFSKNKFSAYYCKMSVEGFSEQGKKEMLEAWPITEAGNVYVFANIATERERSIIAHYWRTSLALNETDMLNYYKEIVELAKQLPTAKQQASALMFTEFNGYSQLKGISLPSTIENIVGEIVVPPLPAMEVENNGFVFTLHGKEYGVSCTEQYRSKELSIPERCEGLPVTQIIDLTGCSEVKTITIPQTVTAISEDAFINCAYLENIIVQGENPVYSAENGHLLRKYSEDNILLVVGVANGNIPNGVSDIFRYAFSGRKNLTDVIIPESVQYIGNSAFENCESLMKVELPDNLSGMGFAVFKNCSSLAEVNIPNSLSQIEAETFSDCVSLERIVIPESVKKIGDKAFFNCIGLTYVKLPENLEYAEGYGLEQFWGCTNIDEIASNWVWNRASFNLELGKGALPQKIVFYGTEKEWLCRGGGYFGESCIIQCSDNVVSSESWAAFKTVDNLESAKCLNQNLTYFLSDLDVLSETWKEYNNYLNSGIDYDSYEQYEDAEQGTVEYDKYQEYREFREARSRYNTVKNRRKNDLIYMTAYHLVFRDDMNDKSVDEYCVANVHIISESFGETIVYESGKEGDLNAITNYETLSDELRQFIDEVKAARNTVPYQTVAEIRTQYNEAFEAFVSIGDVTEEELINRIEDMWLVYIHED